MLGLKLIQASKRPHELNENIWILTEFLLNIILR